MVVDGEVRFDWPLYQGLGEAPKAHEKDMGQCIVCGGSWVKFAEGPHFELGRYVRFNCSVQFPAGYPKAPQGFIF